VDSSYFTVKPLKLTTEATLTAVANYYIIEKFPPQGFWQFWVKCVLLMANVLVYLGVNRWPQVLPRGW